MLKIQYFFILNYKGVEECVGRLSKWNQEKLLKYLNMWVNLFGRHSLRY